MSSKKRPRMLHALIATVVFQGASGIGGGIALVADPSGAAIGLPATWLAGSPFDDYLIPGLVLSSVLGVAPLVVAWGLWQRRRWAWAGALGIGAMLLVWLTVELAVVGYQPTPPLQLVYGVVALLILALALSPAVRAIRR